MGEYSYSDWSHDSRNTLWRLSASCSTPALPLTTNSGQKCTRKIALALDGTQPSYWAPRPPDMASCIDLSDPPLPRLTTMQLPTTTERYDCIVRDSVLNGTNYLVRSWLIGETKESVTGKFSYRSDGRAHVAQEKKHRNRGLMLR